MMVWSLLFHSFVLLCLEYVLIYKSLLVGHMCPPCSDKRAS
jgi:hypothetical protein